MLLERRIQVGNVRLMMFPVVNLHRLRIDVRLECGEIVGELRKFVSHEVLLGSRRKPRWYSRRYWIDNIRSSATCVQCF